jgi:endoglucanase
VNGFLVAPHTAAKDAARALRGQNHPDAKLMELVANNTVGVWYGAWSGDISTSVKAHAAKALSSNATAVMVPYNIPYRDCGSHSAGGIPAGQYRTWISQFAQAVGQAKAVIVLEPDALALTECLNNQTLGERFELLRYAIQQFSAKAPRAKVYIDAGHPAWLSPEKAAERLKLAGVEAAAGFALNTSNYFDNKRVIDYGSKIRTLVKKNFVIDTSRNGRGSAGDNEWCNPAGRGLGTIPTAKTNAVGVDAFLWIKTPGESDGNCGGGPSAGQFWHARALELARNANLKVPVQSSAQKSDEDVPASSLPDSPSTPESSPAPRPATFPAPAPAPAPSPSPAPAPAPAPVPTPTPPTSGGSPRPSSNSDLVATINVKSEWQSGYCADIVISNQGSSAVSTWTLVLNLNGTRLAQQWNVQVTSNGDRVTLRPVADWNANVNPGGSVNQQGFCVDTPNNNGAKASVESIN